MGLLFVGKELLSFVLFRRHFHTKGFLGDLGRGERGDSAGADDFLSHVHGSGLACRWVTYEDDIEVRIVV